MMMLEIEENIGMSLKSLVVSPQAVAEETLAGALQGLVSIAEGTGEVMPSSTFTKLENNTQVLAYLLGLRASVILGYRKDGSVTAGKIAAALGLDVQRTRECLSRLKGKYLNRTTEGYEVQFTRIAAACEELVKRRVQ